MKEIIFVGHILENCLLFSKIQEEIGMLTLLTLIYINLEEGRQEKELSRHQ